MKRITVAVLFRLAVFLVHFSVFFTASGHSLTLDLQRRDPVTGATLARDMTDAHPGYDPSRNFTPDLNTEQVIEHFEKHLAPTIGFIVRK